jgi:hypothetical protein
MTVDPAVNSQGQRPARSLKHGSALLLLLVTELEVLATLNGALRFVVAGGAFETESNLLSSLCLLVKDWLCLAAETRLLPIVTPFALRVV